MGDALLKQVEIVKDKKLASFVTNAPGSKNKKNTEKPDEDNKELERNDDFENMNIPQMHEEEFSENNENDENENENLEDAEQQLNKNEDNLTKKKRFR